MGKALAKEQISKSEFAAELHRAVSNFSATASKEDIKKLLERAQSKVFNRVKTWHVLPCQAAKKAKTIVAETAVIKKRPAKIDRST